APDDRGELPMDRRLDRRAFLQRMTAITAALSSGSAVYPLTPLHASAGAGTAAPPRPARVRVHRVAGAENPFRWPIRLPEPGSIAFDTPADLTIAEAAALIQSGRLSPVELVEACIARIDAFDEVYLAFNAIVRDWARQEARELAGGSWRGPLHGIPLAIKDNYYTAGILTTANSH